MTRTAWLYLAGFGALAGWALWGGQSRKRRPLGATTRRGPRSGAIEIDPRVVDDRVEKMLAAFGECPNPNAKHGYTEPYYVPRGVVVPPVQVRDPATGAEHEVRIWVAPEAHPKRHGVLRTAYNEAYEPIQRSVALSPKVGHCESQDAWRRELRRVLTHELAHAADPYLPKKVRDQLQQGAHEDVKQGSDKLDDHAYRNSREEMTALMAEVARQLRDDQQRIWYEDDVAPDRLLAWSSMRYGEIAPLLTSINKRRFYRLAARIRDEKRAHAAEARLFWGKKRLSRQIRKVRKARRKITT